MIETVFVFGNPDLPEDSLPLRLLPKLKKQFPGINFELKDPNEEWEAPEELCVLDTVLGISQLTIFDNLEAFSNPPRFSLHDFDAISYLKYLQKLGKLKKMKLHGQARDIHSVKVQARGLERGEESRTENPIHPQTTPGFSGARIKIIGLPPTISEKKALDSLSFIFRPSKES